MQQAPLNRAQTARKAARSQHFFQVVHLVASVAKGSTASSQDKRRVLPCTLHRMCPCFCFARRITLPASAHTAKYLDSFLPLLTIRRSLIRLFQCTTSHGQLCSTDTQYAEELLEGRTFICERGTLLPGFSCYVANLRFFLKRRVQ